MRAFLILLIPFYFSISARADSPPCNGADPDVPSFRQDVLPILTRFGCNAGGCHGKLAGQNGFRLSLRAYAPDWDHQWLTTEMDGRRLDFASPDHSLIILKATAQVPHEGGKRFDKDSRAAKTLAAWVAARAPEPDPKEADADRLDLRAFPESTVLKPGDSRQVSVTAHWPDGRTRDVTWLCQFFSTDDTTLKVSETGLVKSLRPGEAAVRVHFQGLVQTLLLTTPRQTPVDPAQYSRRNNALDDPIFAKLAALRIPVSPDAGDATFLRRAYIDAIGTLPTEDQARTFLADRSPDKRARLIDDLLARPEWADYWALQICDLLQNRKERDHDVRGPKGVRALHAWVRERLARNRPWNDIARDVLLATGDTVTQPPVGYYVVTVGEKSRVEESELAASVAQAFLGTRIGCAKCHNHPLERYTQDDYYHFAAFFSKVSLKRIDPEKGATALTVSTREEQDVLRDLEQARKQLTESQKVKDAAEGKRKIAESQKRIDELTRRLADVRAKPPTVTQPRTKQPLLPQPLDRSIPDIPAHSDPRLALANWVTDPSNEAFAGAMANRLWRHFMGVGLVEPVDDLRSSNPPSNPELFKLLTRQFVAGGYDLKHLTRLIMNSRAYQLSSRTLPENQSDRRFYSHYYAKRMPAEVLLDAISQATGVPDAFPAQPVGVRAIQLPDPAVNSYFLTIFGRSDRVTACACERTADVTLPQVLHLTNGPEVQQKIQSPEGRLAALLKTHSSDAALIESIFLSTLSRRPTDTEKQAITRSLETTAASDRPQFYRDLVWALLNSKEFAFNH